MLKWHQHTAPLALLLTVQPQPCHTDLTAAFWVMILCNLVGGYLVVNHTLFTFCPEDRSNMFFQTKPDIMPLLRKPQYNATRVVLSLRHIRHHIF
jgi:hypothetical protein